MPPTASTQFSWLNSGDEGFAAMLEAIARARHSVRLETYTFTDSELGVRFLNALIEARARGATVKVVVDFVGSSTLRSSFWVPLQEAGGEFRWFNPWNLWRLGIRDHRKILVCDERVSFVGGFNISPEYEGDGVRRGWRDLGMRIEGPLSAHLAEAFDMSFERADFKHKPLQRLRKNSFNRRVAEENWTLLLSGPGRGRKVLKQSLARDMARAKSIQLVTAYFLPTWRLRRELFRARRRSARVSLILPGISDIPFSQMAARCLYRPLLHAGASIHEYRPQILHTKLFIIDDYVYVGSANLDARSLNINYELLIRVDDAALARQAREIFEVDRRRSRRVTLSAWKKVRPWWRRRLDRMAYFVLARLDPYLARLRAKNLP